MTKRMLIDATHAEETRVVVLNQDRIEEFDVEAASKKPLKGNIYLAKITRVEPSLQAAFVDYGGNRHGFLSFSEIHPDYYRIPIADREALIAEAAAMRDDDDDDDDDLDPPTRKAVAADAAPADDVVAEDADDARTDDDAPAAEADAAAPGRDEDDPDADATAEAAGDEDGAPRWSGRRGRGRRRTSPTAAAEEDAEVEDVRRPTPIYRRYTIQEVIKRRQILLVQVQKEERGSKGAALTTYLSLAGRYCVLMPNTPRGGGVSRKIASTSDRKRLKTIISDLEIPEGMAVIVRTAGSERTKAEIKRDYDYLLRLWEDIRQRTLDSVAPALVHEESDIVRRAIRDLYQRDFDDVLVEGEDAYRDAKSFMKLLTPSHARRVQHYKDEAIPLFHRHRVDSQLDGIFQPTVQLRSGGYIVINPTEALVSIDVNSGRSTRERNIEDTALKTNLEAAEEVARQLRLRDLAGLIVIDFIDMEDARRNAQVERKLKDSLRSDRARIQVGRISGFGLLEMSRQRLRASLQETAMVPCPQCGGGGLVRSADSAALHVLRAIEDEGVKGRAAALAVTTATAVALFILNEKRTALQTIEARYGLSVFVRGDDSLISPDLRIERTARTTPIQRPKREAATAEDEIEDEDADEAAADAEGDDAPSFAGGDDAPRRRRRGRRGGRRRRRSEDEDAVAAAETEDADAAAPINARAEAGAADAPTHADAAAPIDAETVAGEIAAPKPKRTRAPRKTTAGVDAQASGDAAASEEAEAPKLKRTRAPRKTKADAGTEAQAEPGAAEPAPTNSAATAAPAETVAVETVDAIAAPERDVSTTLEADQPRKRGWWSRVTGS